MDEAIPKSRDMLEGVVLGRSAIQFTPSKDHSDSNLAGETGRRRWGRGLSLLEVFAESMKDDHDPDKGSSLRDGKREVNSRTRQ